MDIHLENGRYLDLPDDLELNVTHGNPLILEQGTYSLPVLLPGTDNNMKLLQNPPQFDNVYKHVIKWPAYIKQGSFQKKASLNILEAGDDIDVFFQMNESEMYAKMKETTLSSAFDIKRFPRDLPTLPGYPEGMDQIIRYLELVKVNNFPNEDFRLFEVATDKSEWNLDSDPNHAYDVLQFLNESFRSKDTETIPTTDFDLTGLRYTVFRGRYPHTVFIDGQLIEVPKGYGITPFLKLNFMLRRIFEYFGYKLEESIFDTDPELKEIVVLNNTADSIVREVIDYSQLVPSGTVDDFLNNIRQAFGCEFFVSEDNRRVNIKFWNDILSDIRLEKDWTPYLTSRPKKKIVEPKTIKLTFKRSFDYASVPYDTLAKYEQTFGEYGFRETIPYNVSGWADGYYLIGDQLRIFEVYTDQDTLQQKKRLHSRPLYDYYQDSDNLEFEERSSDLEYVPSVSGYAMKGLKLTNGELSAPPIYKWLMSNLYIGKRRHMNTVLEKNTSDESGAVQAKEVEETAGTCLPAIVFYRHKITDKYIGAIGYGTPFHFDDEGNSVGTLDLIPGGKNGLFEHFLRILDDVLRNSYQQITVTLNLPEKEIVNFRMDKLICIGHQPLLPELMEYIVKEKDIDVNKVVFRTIRIYKDK